MRWAWQQDSLSPEEILASGHTQPRQEAFKCYLPVSCVIATRSHVRLAMRLEWQDLLRNEVALTSGRAHLRHPLGLQSICLICHASQC